MVLCVFPKHSVKQWLQNSCPTVLTLEQDIQEQEEQRAAEEAMQVRLDQTSALLQKLQQVQSDRLSLTPPAHLSHVVQPSDSEVQLGKLVNVIFFLPRLVRIMLRNRAKFIHIL